MNKNFKVGTLHPALASVTTAHTDIIRLTYKLRFLTGTYQLQSNRVAFNQNAVNATCPLCKTSDETATHVLTKCTATHEVRNSILQQMQKLLNSIENCAKCVRTKDSNDETQLILDPSRLVAYNKSCKCINAEIIDQLEFHSRRLCYHIHRQRTKFLTDNYPKCKKKAVVHRK